ncbi:MAG: putative toxin-antitoxin system toxin component, PIN family [Steroidobacteraceae bacterium]
MIPTCCSPGCSGTERPHTLLERVRDGTVTLVSSPALLAELAEVIERPHFASVLARSNTSRERSLAEVQALAEVTAPAPLPAPVCRDPDDGEVLALARATQVDLIVSGDKDLLDLNSFESIPIVTPAEALHRIDASA